MNASTTTKVVFVLFLLVVLAWRARETFRKQGSERGQISMRWSFYALFTMSCLIFLGTVLEFCFVDRRKPLGVALAGVALFAISNVVRATAVRTLGRFWSLHIEIRNQQPLIREGIYGYVRHPAYLAFVLEAVAIPLVGSAWWSLAFAGLVFVPVLLLRMRREEKVLVARFGATYQAYQGAVGALFPRWSAFRRPRPVAQGSS